MLITAPRLLTSILLFFAAPLAIHASDFGESNNDLRSAVQEISERACSNALFSEVCLVTRNIDFIFVAEPNGVERILVDALVTGDKHPNSDIIDKSWANTGLLFSLPSDLCTLEKADAGYCKDFRCLLGENDRSSSVSCPTTPRPNSTAEWFQKNSVVDKLCKGDLCVPIDAKKADARRFLTRGAAKIATDVRNGTPLKESIDYRYRCWFVAQNVKNVALSLDLDTSAFDDQTNDDCGMVRTLLPLIRDALPRPPTQLAPPLRTDMINSPIAGMAQKPEDGVPIGYKILSRVSSAPSPIAGIAYWFEPTSSEANTTRDAHIVMLVAPAGTSTVPSHTSMVTLAPLDLGITATVELAADGSVKLWNAFAQPEVAIDQQRLTSALQALFPPSIGLALTVENVKVDKSLSPISFDGAVALPWLGLKLPPVHVQLDCHLESCGLGALLDKATLQAALDKQIASVKQLPAQGTSYISHPTRCNDEKLGRCFEGVLVSTSLFHFADAASNIPVRLYSPPNSRLVLVGNDTQEALIAAISDNIANLLKSHVPAFKPSWLILREPSLHFRIDPRDPSVSRDLGISWSFTSIAEVRVSDHTVSIPLSVSDSTPLKVETLLGPLGNDFANRAEAYAKQILIEPTINQATLLLDRLKAVQLFGQTVLPEGLACNGQTCTFSLTGWFDGVRAKQDSGSTQLCFADAKINSNVRQWLRSVLPGGGALSVDVQQVNLIPGPTDCSASLPRLSFSLIVGIPTLGLDPDTLNLEVDPNTGSISLIRDAFVQHLRSKLLAKVGSINSLSFRIDDVAGLDPLTVRGSFALPSSDNNIVGGQVDITLSPLKVTFTCASNNLVSGLTKYLNLPFNVKATVDGCDAFPIIVSADITLPILNYGTNFAVSIQSNGQVQLAEPITIPLVPIIPIPGTPLFVNNLAVAVSIAKSDYEVKGLITAASFNQLGIDARLQALLAQHTIALNGNLLLASIRLAHLNGSFDGRVMAGKAELLIPPNLSSAFELQLSPLSYSQTLNLNAWNQVSVEAVLRIDSTGALCETSGLPSLCFTGKADLKIGRGEVLLLLKPQLNDFASLKASLNFANIAQLQLRGTSRRVSVRIDAGIVKLTVGLPVGVGSLTPDAIRDAIAAALRDIHIDPTAFLRGDWQVTFASQSHEGLDGDGEEGSTNGGDVTGAAQSGAGTGKTNATSSSVGPQIDHGDGSNPVSSPPAATDIARTGGTSGDSEQVPWSQGTCKVHFSQQGEVKFQRQLNCTDGSPAITDPCIWSSEQVNRIRNHPDVVLLPMSVDTSTGYIQDDLSLYSGNCETTRYRIYATQSIRPGDCSTGLCVMRFGGGLKNVEAINLGTIEELQVLFDTTDNPAASLVKRRGMVLTAQQWGAIFTLASDSFATERSVESLSCYMRVSDKCEMFSIKSLGTNRTVVTSLVAAFGTIKTAPPISEIQISAVDEVMHLSRGLLAVFNTPSGQMIGYWTASPTSAPALVIPLSAYVERRSCWQKHNYAPSMPKSGGVLMDYSETDDIFTESWKAREWHKSPLLLLIDSSCK